MFPDDKFEQYWNSSEKKGYAGVAIITKIKPIQVLYGIHSEKHDLEARVVTAEFLEFYLVAVYAPHSGHCLHRLSYRVDEWDKDFHSFLNGL